MAIGGLGMLAAFGAVFFLLMLILYVYVALVLMTIAKKTKTEKAWLAWIPIANIYLMTQIAGAPWWWVLIVVLAVFIPFIGGLIALAGYAFLWWKIAEARGKPGWWGLLAVIIPVVNLVFMGMIAWSE